MASLSTPEFSYEESLDVVQLFGPQTWEQYGHASAEAIDTYLGEIAFHLPEFAKLAPRGEEITLCKTADGYLTTRYLGDLHKTVYRWSDPGSTPRLAVALAAHASEEWLGAPIYKEYGLTYEAGVIGNRPSIDIRPTTTADLENCPFIPRILNLLQGLHEEYFHHFDRIPRLTR